jgi:hypothetical protein
VQVRYNLALVCLLARDAGDTNLRPENITGFVKEERDPSPTKRVPSDKTVSLEFRL